VLQKLENAIAVFKWNLPHVRQIQVYSSLTSTNTFAKEQVQQGAEHGTVIWALEQTAGRGRRNRTWFSDISSLTFSLIWWLPNYRKASLVPLALGLGIAQELQIYSSSIKVKWPNDIWAGDKKLAGILCESTRSESGLWVVAGIGINVNRPRFEAAFPAASLEECTGHPLTRLGVLFQVLHGANNGISQLFADRGPDSLIGRLASAIMGSSETTFYVLTVYTGAVGIRNFRHSLAASLFSDIIGFIAAVFIVFALFR
jgi:biotin-[acetyl-CoA-carboxylase] ligase BirA-like protein